MSVGGAAPHATQVPHTPRIGLFGGAFDPPHCAHVALVRSAMAALQLDAVHIVPTGHAWHKSRTLTQAHHRLAMTRLAFADVPQAVVDACEIEREGPSYTLDTLHALAAQHPKAQLYLLLGQDQQQSLDGWHGIAQIRQMAIICAAQRSAHAPPWHPAANAACPNAASAPPLAPPPVLHLPMPAMRLSATDIRAQLAQGQTIAGQVPAPVERYIQHHHLYTAPRPESLP